MSLVTDTGTVFVRELRPTLRDPISVFFSLGQPLIMLVLFGPLLAGMPGLPGTSPWQWFVPGILVMAVVTGTSATGSNLSYEMITGSHERLMVTPLSRSSLLVGRALKELAPLLVQALLIVLAVLPLGFRLYPAGAAVGLVLLAVFGVGLGAFSYALAIVSRNREWLFWLVTQSLLFPLLILSGMLLPLERAPAWMWVLSEVNPVTHIVEAERALFSGEITRGSVLYGTVAAVAFAAVGLAVGIRAMRRATV